MYTTNSPDVGIWENRAKGHPALKREGDVAMSTLFPIASPVMRSETARQPPQRSWLIIQFGEPSERRR